MDSGYTITTDSSRGLLHMTLRGFFDLATVQAIDKDRREALARLQQDSNRHVTLCDVSACKLQSQEIVAAFQLMLADTVTAGRRIAFGTGRSLSRMQLRRIAGGPGMGCFETVAEAEAWLFLKADDDRVAA